MKDIALETDPEPAGLSVQAAAERLGLSGHTLRYYERIGLITPVTRQDSSGHRRYSEQDLQGIRFLLYLRATGMPIQEMQHYVALYREGDRTLPERNALMEKHRCRVRDRIAEMQGHLQVIEHKLQTRLCLWRERMEAGEEFAPAEDCRTKKETSK